jgi:hypothetical protein
MNDRPRFWPRVTAYEPPPDVPYPRPYTLRRHPREAATWELVDAQGTVFAHLVLLGYDWPRNEATVRQLALDLARQPDDTDAEQGGRR